MKVPIKRKIGKGTTEEDYEVVGHLNTSDVTTAALFPSVGEALVLPALPGTEKALVVRVLGVFKRVNDAGVITNCAVHVQNWSQSIMKGSS